MSTLAAVQEPHAFAHVPPPAAESASVEYIPGAKKKPVVLEVAGRRFRRIPVKSRLVKRGDDVAELIASLTDSIRQPSDIVAISEKAVAVSQGRAIPESEIRIGFLAGILWRFVRKVPYGIGLGSPATMQCAINECGAPRILLATAAGALGKLVGRRGDFYRVAGIQAAAIDAASTSPIPELNGCVVLCPKDPDGVARNIASRLGCRVAVVDINDLGGKVLGASEGIDPDVVTGAMRDNPLGQGAELTPFCVIRELV